MMSEQFELLMTFPGRPSAEMAAAMLEGAGITSLIKSPSDTGMFGEISFNALLSYELHVPAGQLEEARAVLAPLLDS